MSKSPPAKASQAKTPIFTPVLLASCAILLVGFGIRGSFGLFQIPIAEQFGWPRAEFSLAIAIQNLAWGIGQPIFGAIGERFGDKKAITLGAILYALGLVLSANAVTPGAHQLLNILIGFGIAGTGFGVILAIVGRAAADSNRSLVLGIATAAGSGGQVVGPPLAEALLGIMPWSSVFLVFAGLILATLAAAAVPQGHGAQHSGPRRGGHGRGGQPGGARPELRSDLHRLFLLRLSARLHHRAFPRLHHRGLRADHARAACSRASASPPPRRSAPSPSR